MKSFYTLMQREWMQHRFGWTLLALVPLGLAMLLLAFGQIEIEDDARSAGAALPALVAMVTMGISTLVVFGILWVTSVILISGLPRRDHADRSNEFWLSLPTAHAPSLAAPLLMHLIVVPAAALAVGLAGGWLLSMVTVARVTALSEWFSLPWGSLLVAMLSGLVRVLVGLPLATLWLLPLILLVMLATAWFRRWGPVILAVGFGLGSLVLEQGYGISVLSDTVGAIFSNAARALVASGHYQFSITGPESVTAVMRGLPAWVAGDLGAAFMGLLSLRMVGGLLFAAGCFALLMQWRRRAA
jgi:ABC-2 type transport system permease protein